MNASWMDRRHRISRAARVASALVCLICLYCPFVSLALEEPPDSVLQAPQNPAMRSQRVFTEDPLRRLAFVGWGNHLIVLDMSNPSSPYGISGLITPGPVTGVFYSDTILYVANGIEGLRIVNVADPGNPVEMGACDTPSYARDVFVAGPYAYVADHAFGLRIIDVGNPNDPAEIGSCDTPSYAYAVHVTDDYAHVATHHNGYRVIDVSDPVNPREVGYYLMPEDRSGIWAYERDAEALDETVPVCIITESRELPAVMIAEAFSEKTPSNTTRISFTISRSGPVQEALTVRFAAFWLKDGDACHEARPGDVTIPAFVSSAAVELEFPTVFTLDRPCSLTLKLVESTTYEIVPPARVAVETTP